MTTLLSNKRSVGLKVEATAGTAETLGSANFDFPVKDVELSENIQRIERDYYRASGGNVPSLTGSRRGSISFTSELRGSGNHVTEAPVGATILKACGMSEKTDLHTLPIGAITGGPFVVGETITGGTSTETAIVAKTTYTGESVLYVYNPSGAFTGGGETLTGGTSSATASSSAGETEVGYAYVPQFSGYSNYTCGVQMGAKDTAGDDALEVKLSGALGTFELSTTVGGICEVRATFSGGIENPADVASFFASDAAAVSATPPQFFNANVKTLGNYSVDVSGVTFSLGGEVRVPTGSTNTTGISPAIFADFKGAQGSFDPYLDLITNHDFFLNWFNATTGVVEFTLGSTAGNKFIIQAPNAQYTGITGQDRDNLLAADTTLQLNETTLGNDHLVILAV